MADTRAVNMSMETHDGSWPLAEANPAARLSTTIERIVFIGFLAGLAICPFWLGSNRLGAWGLNAILFASLVIVLEISFLLQARPRPVPISQLKLPAIGFALVVGWVWMQAVSFTPSGWHHPIWSIASGELSTSLAGSISVNSDATLVALIRLVTSASAFWLALQLCWDIQRALQALMVIGLIGTLYAVYGIVSFFAAPEYLLWFPKTYYKESLTSTFINRNSFATYMGLTLVAMFGVLLKIFRDSLRMAQPEIGAKVAAVIQALAVRGGIYFLAAAFTMTVALFLTGSRGGVGAATIGLAVLVVLTLVRRKANWALGSVLALGLVTYLVAMVVYGDGLAIRLGNVDGDVSYRVAVYKRTIDSILDAPLLGFGFGTFEDVFPIYRDATVGTGAIWDKAHNTYLEELQGLGIPISLIFIAVVLTLVAPCFVGAITLRQNRTPAVVAAAATSIVFVHALVDFSLQIQAVTLTWCALLGTGLAQCEKSHAAKKRRR